MTDARRPAGPRVLLAARMCGLMRPGFLILALLALPAAAPAIGWRDARDTAECRAQVLAAQFTRRQQEAYLSECELLDRQANERLMAAAYDRLGALMDVLIAGRKPRDADVSAVLADAEKIAALPAAPYRTAYLDRLSAYHRLVEQGPTDAQRRAAPLGPPPAAPPGPPPLPAATVSVGRLRDWGGYSRAEPGQLAVALRDGGVFVVGAGRPRADTDDPLQAAEALRQRRQLPAVATVQGGARIWDPLVRGWRNQPPPPGCAQGQASQHTATLLADDTVLVAGGLCDRPRLADDPPAPEPSFTALSIWDPKQRAWRQGPALRQGRIDHAATLLADGSVLFTGGLSDPASAPDRPDVPVLAGSERYAAGAMAAAPDLRQPRALHSASLMADGSVLVAGGHDAEGRALASVERWMPGEAAWQALPPMRFPRHGHTATLLADGRLLVAGGVGADGVRLTAVEVWEPATGAWRAAPSLAVPLAGHAALRLADGGVLLAGGARLRMQGVVPWGWVWRPGDTAWHIAGHVAPDLSATERITLVARPDGGALAFSPRGILRWDPAPLPPGQAPPVWPQQAPAATRLADGRVLFVGIGLGEDHRSFSAWLWSPGDGGWQPAARPARGGLNTITLQTLRGGDVLLLGVASDRRMVCQRWKPAGDSWAPCGEGLLQYLPAGHLQPALLPDGRAYVIVNLHEALVHDEATQRWATWRPEWDVASLPLGAPVTLPAPLARLRDPARVDQPIDISEAGARFRVHEGSVPRMLWDASAGRWAYILPQGMGADAQAVPGGCAVSTTPFARFDAAAGRAVALPDPGFGSAPGLVTMLVLPGGGVVAAGVAPMARDPGAGFWQGRAGCAGFEAGPDDAGYVSATAAADVAPPAAPAATSAPEPKPPAKPLWERTQAWVAGHPWLPAAVLGPLVLGLLLHRRRWRRLPGGSSWVLRALVYGLVAFFVAPAAWRYWQFERAQRLAEPAPAALPAHAPPCRLVGVWTSQQGRIIRRVELKDDGSYVMHPSAATGIDPPGGWRGHWSVDGRHLVWRHEGRAELDVNPIEDDQGDRFTLVEQNGQRTRFERVKATASTRCTT